MTKEPLITVAVITAAVAAIINLVTAFGLNLTTGQTESIMGITGVIAALVVGATARGYVTPWSTVVEQKVDGALISGPADTPEA